MSSVKSRLFYMICRLVVAAALMELMELILLDVLVVLGKTPMFSLSSWLALS